MNWITHANAYLPLDGEGRRKTAEDVIAHRMKFQKTPTFEETNSIWARLHFFSNDSRAELLATAQAVGIHTWRSIGTERLRRDVAMHFHLRVEDMSHGRH